ncbi:MAG TPA: hypothetical protein VOA64_20615 [Candidatus Dormibacteraeota bacterium]|nr:hypothetical protein [Candidatus Dormibacteraeota bacterium]
MSETSGTRKAALWLAVVFFLGVALGGVFGNVLAHRSRAEGHKYLGDPSWRAEKVDALTRKLSLTNDQRQELDVILTDIQEQMKAIHKQMAPQMDEVRQKGRARIRAILTPEQMPGFEEFIKKLDEDRKRREH